MCLTITKISKKLIYFYISNETLKRSNFKSVKIDQLINIEKWDVINNNYQSSKIKKETRWLT